MQTYSLARASLNHCEMANLTKHFSETEICCGDWVICWVICWVMCWSLLPSAEWVWRWRPAKVAAPLSRHSQSRRLSLRVFRNHIASTFARPTNLGQARQQMGFLLLLHRSHSRTRPCHTSPPSPCLLYQYYTLESCRQVRPENGTRHSPGILLAYILHWINFVPPQSVTLVHPPILCTSCAGWFARDMSYRVMMYLCEAFRRILGTVALHRRTPPPPPLPL